ncbi:MAG: NAD(P)-binding protein, partial [Myxococcota bacterium]
MSQHYDVAVIGTQTSGLIAAALLAKQERRVVVIDHGENVRFYRHHGVHMPLVPTLVPSFEDSPAIKRVHEELGIGPEIRAQVAMDEPVFQAITPGHRIDVFSKAPAFLEELGKEFPDLVEPVRRFLDRLFELDREISTVLADLAPLPPPPPLERRAGKRKRGEHSHENAPNEDAEV